MQSHVTEASIPWNGHERSPIFNCEHNASRGVSHSHTPPALCRAYTHYRARKAKVDGVALFCFRSWPDEARRCHLPATAGPLPRLWIPQAFSETRPFPSCCRPASTSAGPPATTRSIRMFLRLLRKLRLNTPTESLSVFFVRCRLHRST